MRANTVCTCIFMCVAIVSPALLAGESKAEPTGLVSLQIVPQSVTLRGSLASQHFVVSGEYADGLSRDITSQAGFALSEKAKGEIDGSGKFVARGDGDVVLTAVVEGHSATASIHIENVNAPRPFTFARDIGGILTRNGCNDTMCHGSVKGRGGFKLSVYALVPREDYQRIVQGGTFRVLTTDENPRHPRINTKEPEKSPVLLKPTFSVPHGGGLRFSVGSPDYLTLLNWIKSGAPYGDEAEKQGDSVKRVELYPQEAVLDTKGRQQFTVTAYLNNGRQEDITEQAHYDAETGGVIAVNDSGLVEAKKPGQSNVIIRTAGGYTLNGTVKVIQHPISGYPKLESRNFIDDYVFAKLRRFQILPSEPASDAEFLRRVCLDLCGTLPPAGRVREFLADKTPDKRDRLIETLLHSPQFVDHWTFRFSDLMRVTFTALGDARMTQAYEDWIFDSIAANKPYDQMARERIAAQGYSAPARNLYFQTELRTPETQMPELVRVFMGRRIECAQCHNHPFETWTQNQFWGLAAFFAGTTELRNSVRLDGARSGYVVFDVLGGGHVDQPREMSVHNPRTKQLVAPTFLDGTKLPADQWGDPRMRLAQWITSSPYFAEATVNRVWGYFFGRGIVQPVDDFRSSNPPSNPELLQALANDFRNSGFDLKHLMRTIVQSKTYQLSGTPNESNKDDTINYSHAQPRAMEAAVLLDAITSTTGVPEKFQYALPSDTPGAGEGVAPRAGARAVQMMPEVCPSQFMDAYGRSMRSALPVGPSQPNLLEALDMLAGTAYTSKIPQAGGRLDGLLKKGATDEEIIEEFYLAGLTRFPTIRDKARILAYLSQRSMHRSDTLSRLVWAIISSREFEYNH